MTNKTKDKLKKDIESILSVKKYTDKQDMRANLKNAQLLISKYELEHYANYTDEIKEEIAEYRNKISEIIKFNKFNEKNKKEVEPVDDEGINVLKLLNKQIMTADLNQALLEKGTLKLETLNYTNGDICKEIEKANKKIKEQKNKEKIQIAKIKWAYKLLLFVCILILCDKLYMRIIRPSISVYKYFKPKQTVVQNYLNNDNEISAEKEIL